MIERELCWELGGFDDGGSAALGMRRLRLGDCRPDPELYYSTANTEPCFSESSANEHPVSELSEELAALW